MKADDRMRWMLLTGFGTGLSPFASGTVGTLPAIPPAVLICGLLPTMTAGWTLLALAAGLFLFGIGQSKFIAKRFRGEDPGQIVLDEIVGYLVTIAMFCLLAAEPDPTVFAVGFLLFRFFDIAKITPADRAEEMHGAMGIMADDVIAGIYAGICLIVAHSFEWV